ncbi:hypothetical protein C8Q80DRAFT_566041 [Daedaleopsis nitida]|nr:hypothetical protein C8Q80DRAFT_566041 [Daedaleopsis nitida]
MSSVFPPIQPGSVPPAATMALSPAPRPNLVRRETDQILSYYHSELAGRHTEYDSYASAASDSYEPPSQLSTTTSPYELPHPRPHIRQDSSLSSASDYSSHYSESDDCVRVATPENSSSTSEFETSTPRTSAPVITAKQATSGHTYGDEVRHSRRPSVPTEGGADRRRVAIVEMDPPTTAPLPTARKSSKGFDGKSTFEPSSSDPASAQMLCGTLFSRRGVHLGGLALVAPPDASPKTYTNLTPPSTAPVSTCSAHAPPSAFAPSHTRSASEAVNPFGSRSRLHHKSSRDIGIVGLSSASTASESLGPASPTSDEYPQCEGLGVPIFQTPAKSRSPSPGVTTPELSDTSSAGAFCSPHQRLLSTPIFGMEAGIITPAIGEGKDIHQPVVGPVIVGLSPELLHGAASLGGARASAPARASPSLQSPTSSSPPNHTSFPSFPSPSPYLHYHPSIHATAGPLPPPPRSIIDRDVTSAAPPRPPRYHTPLPSSARRDIDAIKEALQLPHTVSAKLAARTPPESDKRLASESTPSRPESSRENRSQESAYSQESDSEPSVKLVAAHTREGAFPPSKIISPTLDKRSDEPFSQEPTSPRSDTRPIVVIEQDEPAEDEKESPRRPGLELRRESSWVSLSQEPAHRRSYPGGNHSTLPVVSVSRSPSSISQASSSSSVSHLPSLPPKSIRHGSDDEKPSAGLAPSAFKALTNLKRFSSLPRTPSHSSRSSKRSMSPDARRSISPPPPSVHVQLPPRRRVIPKPKYSHTWPPAMDCADVVRLRGAGERARAYAHKINELAMYDCGLREWMATQTRGTGSHPRTQSQRTAHQQEMHPVPLELGGMAAEIRHVSHGSMASEMTFPIRADAYMATDLSTRPSEAPPTTAPPAILPYPSLAQAQLQRAPARHSTLLSPTKSLQIPLPGSKSSGTGFFASLGRKTSIRKDRGGGLLSNSPQSPTKVLTRQRPIAIAATQSSPMPSRTPPTPLAPSVPGGPRAAPGHIQRAKTFSVGAGPSQPSSPQVSASPPKAPAVSQSPQSTSQVYRQSTAPARRPSLFARARAGHASAIPTGSKVANMAMDRTFELQVDRLADLLPHADRAILAGYLRRAGEDILAIGQYLEDEKNGTLRKD